MATFRAIIFFFLVLLISSTAISQAQPQNSLESDSLRVGLVLSGGGALGIAHLGVIEAIEEAGIRIDYITGTSMGSLVGGLYAIGYTTDELIEIALSNNFTELFTERPNRRYISNYEKITDRRTIASFPITQRRIDLPVGIISGQNVYTFLSNLTWNVHGVDNFDNFQIPFAAVATELESGTAKVFRSGYLPDAIRASISIPSIFAPHNIDGRLYIDGGLIRNIPVQDAIDMGANYTIAVDVSTPLMAQDSLNTLSKILNQTLFYRIQDYASAQREIADYVVSVDELIPYSSADFDLAETFIEIGRRAGEAHLDEFKKIAEMQRSEPVERSRVGQPEAHPVNNIVIEGNTLFDDDFILRKLEFIPGSYLSPDVIEEKVTQLYSSQYINQVTYRVTPDDNGDYNLYIYIVENRTDSFAVGLRYESESQASILLETNFSNLIHNGSLTRFEARLGDRIHFKADHIYYGALGSSLALLTSLQYNAEDVDVFIDNSRVSRFRNQVVRGELSAGNYFSSQNLVTAGIRKDFQYQTDRINPDQIFSTNKDYHALFLRYTHDSFNRRAYTTNGYKVVAEGFYSDQFVLSPLNFLSLNLYWKGFFEITNSFSVRNSLLAGYNDGESLPWSYSRTPNRYDDIYGYLRFGGAGRYEISAPNIQMASFGLQIEPFYHRFLAVDVYAGRFMNEWNLSLTRNDIEYGASLTVGALTILGPVKAIFSTGTLNSFKAELQIGYQF